MSFQRRRLDPHLSSPAGRGRDCRHSPESAPVSSPAQRGRIKVGV
ncbi:hypothetical protein [Azospirillum largimobile]